jgi:K+-sensing histidine kinase KdpD
VNTDKILLGKIFDNVISNALKYSEPGSEVMIGSTVEGGKNIISVKDQGPGLPADELNLIFNKFQKLTPKPTLGEATTGLGMYLAREFSAMLKIEVTVKTHQEKGLLVKIII